MHEFIMKIGLAILNFFRGIDFSTVKSALSITLTGWLGIFVVTIVIILIVMLLKKLSSLLPGKD